MDQSDPKVENHLSRRSSEGKGPCLFYGLNMVEPKQATLRSSSGERSPLL